MSTAPNTTSLVEQKTDTFKALLVKHQSEISAALPKHLTPERMMQIAVTEARKVPELLNCELPSLYGAVIQAAQLGLEPGGALGHCYLLPFKNNNTGKKEVQFIIGYKGMLSLVARTGEARVMARAVYEGDEFSYAFGLNERLDHKPVQPQGPVKLTHVYAVATFRDGTKTFDVMDRDQVEEIRSLSKAAESGPWSTHFEEMAKKTVIRRLFKYLPTSTEVQKAIGLDELADAGVSQDNGSIIDHTTQQPVGNADSIKAAFNKPALKDVSSEQPPAGVVIQRKPTENETTKEWEEKQAKAAAAMAEVQAKLNAKAAEFRDSEPTFEQFGEQEGPGDYRVPFTTSTKSGARLADMTDVEIKTLIDWCQKATVKTQNQLDFIAAANHYMANKGGPDDSDCPF